MSEVTHYSPRAGKAHTPCCGRLVFELPRTDRMTVDHTLVTCPDWTWRAGANPTKVGTSTPRSNKTPSELGASGG